jgi:hypothetical protein
VIAAILAALALACLPVMEGCTVYLTADQILEADDLVTEDVETPEWGGTVRVKALTGTERDSYEAACVLERPVLNAKGKVVRGQTEYKRNLSNVRAKLVVRSIVDEAGQRIFKDSDAAALGGKSSAALDRVFDVAARLSRLSEDDVEDLAGKSEAAQSGDSPSDSPESSDSPQ